MNKKKAKYKKGQLREKRFEPRKSSSKKNKKMEATSWATIVSIIVAFLAVGAAFWQAYVAHKSHALATAQYSEVREEQTKASRVNLTIAGVKFRAFAPNAVLDASYIVKNNGTVEAEIHSIAISFMLAPISFSEDSVRDELKKRNSQTPATISEFLGPGSMTEFTIAAGPPLSVNSLQQFSNKQRILFFHSRITYSNTVTGKTQVVEHFSKVFRVKMYGNEQVVDFMSYVPTITDIN